MSTCHHCGQDIPQRPMWKGLMATEDGQVFWRGIRAVQFRPSETRVLRVLARTGYASRLALEMACAGVSVGLVRVHIFNLRRKLREAGIPIAIVCVNRVGWRLELSEEAQAA